MWDVVGYIGSAFSLVAFLGAVVAYSLREKAISEERLIRSAPEGDRAKLVVASLAFFHVDTSKLTSQQQFDVVMEQIRTHRDRHQRNVVLIGCIAIILAVLSAVAIYSGGRPAEEQSRVPEPLLELVHSSPTSLTRVNARGSAVQVFENGWMFADFDREEFYALSRDDEVQWQVVRSDYVKGSDAKCDDPTGQQILRLGFCWFYNLESSAPLRKLLGRPLARATRAWLQIQNFDEDLLIYGLPTTKPCVETGVYQTLAAVYLSAARTSKSGQGRYKLISPGSLASNPYCSANWYAARIDRQLPEALRQLISTGQCQSALGVEQLTTPALDIRVL